VAARAAGLADGACFIRAIRAAVTGAARGIVPARGSRHCSVRIVAGGATDAGISRVVALAVGQPVRLKPDVADPEWAFGHDLRPCAMTAAAKFRRLLSRHLTDPGRASIFYVPRLHGFHVPGRLRVTILALNTGDQPVEMDTETLYGAGRMTRETFGNLFGRYGASRCLDEISRG
jgi:hypothetical protein